MPTFAAEEAPLTSARRTAAPRILSLCCLYPNPLEPNQGLFVQRRVRHLAELAPVQMVAPIALVQYGNPRGQRLRFGRECPRERREGSVPPVMHPRWFYPPLSGAAAPLLLALQLAPKLARLRRDFPFDVIDTHFGFPEGIAGAWLSRWFHVPFTMTLRGNEPKHSRAGLDRASMRWALRSAARVFTVSERLREFAIGLGADPAKAITIPNGVDTGIFHPRNRTECRVRHGLPVDRKIVLSAGALVERKGHHRIIEALPENAELLIAGGPGPEGEYEAPLRSLVSRLGLGSRVRFLGPVAAETLAEVMCAADVFCLASTNEGWPNVVHEALACGTPVVATDVGAIPEMLAGESFGFIVPFYDSSALREAVRQALKEPWDREAVAAWGGSRDWPKVAAEVLQEMLLLSEK